MILHRTRLHPPTYRLGPATIQRTETNYTGHVRYIVRIGDREIGRPSSLAVARELVRRAVDE